MMVFKPSNSIIVDVSGGPDFDQSESHEFIELLDDDWEGLEEFFAVEHLESGDLERGKGRTVHSTFPLTAALLNFQLIGVK
jgi:hypothetical protein